MRTPEGNKSKLQKGKNTSPKGMRHKPEGQKA